MLRSWSETMTPLDHCTAEPTATRYSLGLQLDRTPDSSSGIAFDDPCPTSPTNTTCSPSRDPRAMTSSRDVTTPVCYRYRHSDMTRHVTGAPAHDVTTVAVEPVGSDEVMHVNHHHYQQQQQQQRRQHSKQQSETETEIEDRDEVMARPIERLSDVLLTRVFYSGLRSDELCRCAAVCRRWNRLVWNPLLWTCIDLTQAADCDTDAALRCLTRILSRDTPTVCLTVERVVLSGCWRLTDRGLRTIARHCTELRTLDLAHCQRVSNVALFDVISRCVSLSHLDVTGCAQVTCLSLTPEANMAAVTYGHQLCLRYVDMSDCCRLDDSGLQLVVTYCPAIVQLYVRRCPLITDLGLQYVAAYSSCIQDISVSDCTLITDLGVGELAVYRRTWLRYVSLAHCPAVSDVALYHLSEHCTRLRYINVRSCVRITDDGVSALASHAPNLRFCDLGDCSWISDVSLRALGAGCPRLRRLSVRGCSQVTDAGVCVIARQCSRLRQLSVLDCPAVGAISLQTVRRCCRQCAIEHNNMAFY